MNRPRRLALAAAAILLLGARSAFPVDAELRRQAKDPEPRKRADAARALAREDSAEAGALVAELLADETPWVRDAAVVACSEMRGDAPVEALAAASRAREELTRRNAAAALGRTALPSALPHLERLATKDTSPAVRADALDALWKYEKVPQALAICGAAAKDGDPSVRAAAVEAAGRVGSLAAADLVRAALSDPDEGVRCVARGQLRYVARELSLATLAAASKDPSWRVRAQTVDDAAWLRDAPAVEALVAMVADPSLRVAGAAHRELRRLSQKDLGRDADVWKAWWEAAKPGWIVPHGKLPDPDAGPGGADAGGATVARYHGIDVTTDRAAFVVDSSGSMRDPIVAGDPKTRAEIARAELLRTLAAVPDGFLVNVILFQVRPVPCFERATSLSRKTREDVAAFLGRTAAADRGNLLAAVLAALEDDSIDTVFLLSDGIPSAGDLVDRVRVQAAIRAANRRRKAAIHTIGFGAAQATQRAFLEGIARDSGGRCVLR